MRKILLLLLVLPFYFTCKLQALTAHITEIINNTDQKMIIKSGAYSGGDKPYISKSISLKTQEETQYLQPNSNPAICRLPTTLDPRTKNVIANFKIPVVCPSTARNYDTNTNFTMVGGGYAYMHFPLYTGTEEYHTYYLVGFRLKGDLLDICRSENINEVYFNDEQLSDWRCYSSLKRISSYATFTIEINQVVDRIFEFVGQNPTCFWGRKSGVTRPTGKILDISIKENNISPQEARIITVGVCPIAYIDKIKPCSKCDWDPETVIVEVKFKKLKDEGYIDNFCNFMGNKDLIKRLVKVTRSSLTDNTTVFFKFYSNDVDRNAFQLLLDQANNAKLHLK